MGTGPKETLACQQCGAEADMTLEGFESVADVIRREKQLSCKACGQHISWTDKEDMKAIRVAMEAEKGAYQNYSKAAKMTRNPRGRDMFNQLHSSALLTGEVSSISKLDGELIGDAKDPLTSGLSMNAFLEEGYFGRSGGHVLCFGAGGSGKAISLHLINKQNPDDRPEKIIVVNRSLGRLDSLQAMVESLDTDITFEYIQNADPQVNDEIMERLPGGSIVINATGMGKDTPGSPVTDQGLFPRNGIAWEINYRGELDFWHQAMAQKASRNLFVEDGWLYFLHGWTQVIADVLHIAIDQPTFNELAEIAAELRPLLVYKPRLNLPVKEG